MSRILYRLVGNNPIQPLEIIQYSRIIFELKQSENQCGTTYLIRCKTLRHLGIKQRVLSIRSVCVPGIVPGCRQVKMTFCRQDYPATSCTPTEKMNWYQLTRLLWSNRDFSPNTPNLYLQSYTRAILYNTSSAVSAEGRKTSYTYPRRLYENRISETSTGRLTLIILTALTLTKRENISIEAVHSGFFP